MGQLTSQSDVKQGGPTGSFCICTGLVAVVIKEDADFNQLLYQAWYLWIMAS